MIEISGELTDDELASRIVENLVRMRDGLTISSSTLPAFRLNIDPTFILRCSKMYGDTWYVTTTYWLQNDKTINYVAMIEDIITDGRRIEFANSFCDQVWIHNRTTYSDSLGALSYYYNLLSLLWEGKTNMEKIFSTVAPFQPNEVDIDG